MRHRIALATLTVAVASALPSAAAIDPSCPMQGSTSAVAGTVQDALGRPVEGMRVELSRTNSSAPIADWSATDAQGRYRVCAGGSGGQSHDTYDVGVRDPRNDRRFASVNQPYTTYTNLGDADFTPLSGRPLLSLTNLTVEPAEISTATASTTVRFVVRSKAPASTRFDLTLGHRSGPIALTTATVEDGGPSLGGWNVWSFPDSFGAASSERKYFASVRGYEGSVETTQFDRVPYVVDNQAPLFGPASATTEQCGSGVTANAFGPASTTNPMPIVRHGVCDRWSGGARSGLDPFSLTGTMCRNAAMTSGCESIRPILDTLTIGWYPDRPLAPGDYWFRWSIADYAGNRSTGSSHLLQIVTRGGQPPVLTAPQPGNMQPGGNNGIIAGSSLTAPPSLPVIGFRALDADGQGDLVPGSVRVQVIYGEDRALVYEYDPFLEPAAYDPASKRGGGTLDVSTGTFRASGYSLSLKPPGRYVATARVTDHGGNTSLLTWQWILVAAV